MSLKKNVVAGGLGTLFEWAEFSFYAYLISKFTHLYFPMLTTHIALLLSFSTFAVSYLVRPIGSFIFGYMGDRYGRKVALTYSMLLMGFATFAMGALPTYAAIGYSAPILLIALRILQGIAVAGEFTGAAVFVAEHYKNKSYFITSWISTFSAVGMLVGAGAAVIIALPFMPPWAWRVPFFIGAVGCAIGFYIRRNLKETEIFTKIEQIQNHSLVTNPLTLLLKNYKLPLLKTATIAAFVGIYIYTCNIWWTSYVIQHNYFTSLDAHLLATIGQASVVILTPIMALLADYFSTQLIMILGFIGAAVFAWILFPVTHTHHFEQLSILFVFYGLCNAMVTGTMFKYLTDIFPAVVRYSGQAIGWSFAVAIFGGVAPLIAQYLSDSFSFVYAPSLYVIASAVLAAVLNYPAIEFCNDLNSDNSFGINRPE